MIRYVLTEGRRVERLCEGCVGSSRMLVALQMECVV